MMAQKKGNTIPHMEPDLLRIVDEFELLWRCISKIRNDRSKGGAREAKY